MNNYNKLASYLLSRVLMTIVLVLCIQEVKSQASFEEVFCGSILEGTTVNRNSDFITYSCIDPIFDVVYDGGDQLYRLEIERLQTVTFQLHSDSTFDLDLFLLSSLDDEPGECIGSTFGSIGVDELLVDMVPGEYWLVVDGAAFGSVLNGNSFVLSIDCFDLPTPCDLIPTVIGGGYPTFGSFSSEITRAALLDFDCIPDIPSEVYGDLFLYHHEGGDLQVDLHEAPSEIIGGIFRCGGVVSESNRSSLCTSDISPGLNHIANLESGFYYLVVASSTDVGSYGFTLNAGSECSHPNRYFVPPYGDTTIDVSKLSNFRESESSYYSCYDGGNLFENEDFIIDFTVDNSIGFSLDFISITPSGPTSFTVFLYSSDCELGCIGYDRKEIDEETYYFRFGDLKSGRYSLLIEHDSAIDYESVYIKNEPIFVIVETCDDCFSDIDHTIVLPDNIGNILSQGDKLLLDFDRNLPIQYESDVFEEEEIIDREKTLCEWTFLLDDVTKCGYAQGEGFVFKLRRKEGNIINLLPFYSPIDNSLITATSTFQADGRSVINRFEVDSINVDKVLFTDQCERSISGKSQTLEVIVGSNASWFTSRTSGDWFDVANSTGSGTTQLRIEVTENTGGDARKDSLLVLGPNGLSQNIIISQLPMSTTVASHESDVIPYFVYPTITRGDIWIERRSTLSPVDYFIYDQYGTLVQEGPIGDRINISTLINGVYYVRLRSNEGWDNFRVIKM